jgi:hypothetical protein
MFWFVGELADADIDLAKEIYVGIYWLLPDRGGGGGGVAGTACQVPHIFT